MGRISAGLSLLLIGIGFAFYYLYSKFSAAALSAGSGPSLGVTQSSQIGTPSTYASPNASNIQFSAPISISAVSNNVNTPIASSTSTAETSTQSPNQAGGGLGILGALL